MPPAFEMASPLALSTERCQSADAARSFAIRLPLLTRPMSGVMPPAAAMADRKSRALLFDI